MRERFELSVAVFVLLKRGNKVLLIRRKKTGWKDGFYSLPAGSLDGNETISAAARRELREETNCLVSESDLNLIHTIHCKNGDSNSEWLGFFFLSEKWRNEPKLMETEKHDNLDWFPLDVLPKEMIDYTKQGIELGLQGTKYSTYGWK